MTRETHRLTLGEARTRAQAPDVMDCLPEHLQTLVGISVLDLPKKFVGRLTEQVLYEYSFDSDEVARAVIYAIDGLDFALAEKYGDRTSYDIQILNREAYARFVSMMADILLDEMDVELADDSTVLAEPNDYISFTDGPMGKAIHIHSPKWYYGFERLFESHDAFHVDEVPVKFVGWANPKARSWEEEGSMIIVELPDGSRKTIDGIEIAFVPKESAVA
jgi:hypothetical protein